jgi:hypothetical protein
MNARDLFRRPPHRTVRSWWWFTTVELFLICLIIGLSACVYG